MLSKSLLEVLLLPPHIVLKCLQVEFVLNPSDELKHKFPSLYMEPMQFNNSEGKQQKEIPYMMINLDYNDEVYIGKNTHVVYIEEESVECNLH